MRTSAPARLLPAMHVYVYLRARVFRVRVYVRMRVLRFFLHLLYLVLPLFDRGKLVRSRCEELVIIRQVTGFFLIENYKLVCVSLKSFFCLIYSFTSLTCVSIFGLNGSIFFASSSRCFNSSIAP